MRPLVAIVALIALTAAGCGGDQGSESTTTSTTPTSTTAVAAQCEAPTYTVDYPNGWSVNQPSDAAPCRWFHPEPFELPEATEVTGIAIHLRYEDVGFSRLADPDNRAEEVLDVRETDIDGRQAVRMHTRSRGEGLLDAGIDIVSWHVDTGSRTLSGATTEAAEGSFETNVTTLDEMMESLRFTADPCSSVEHADLRDLGPEVPEAVKRTRRAIFEAARACDFERLGELANQGKREFTFSFGGGDDPGEFWRSEEAEGADPLYKLAAVLDLSHATNEADRGMDYLWPSAFEYRSWRDVPAAVKEELSRVYTAEEINGFESAGAYLGHRVGIAADGEWLFFVAGD